VIDMLIVPLPAVILLCKSAQVLHTRASYLFDCNFVIHMLFRDIYWISPYCYIFPVLFTIAVWHLCIKQIFDLILSSSSIMWYWSKVSDARQMGKVTAYLAETNGRLIHLYITDCLEPGISCGPSTGTTFTFSLSEVTWPQHWDYLYL